MITMTAILTVLYGMSGFISLAAYVPQFIAFRRDRDACRTTPVSTWLLWWSQSLVVALYAVTLNGDRMFMMAALLSVLALTVCTAMLLYGRWKALQPASNVVPFPTQPTSPLQPTGGLPTQTAAA